MLRGSYMEKVCIVILNWNNAEDTIECLRSVMAIHHVRPRIVVVDNGSHDGSPERIRSAFPVVDLLVNPENLGYAAAINIGIQRALEKGANWVFLLNNDTIVDAELLVELLNAGEAYPRVGVLSPKIYHYHDPERVWFAGGVRRRFPPGIGMLGYGRKDSPAYDRPRKIDYVTGCGMMVKAEVFRAIGLFDEAYFMYHEDLDFCERARREGYECLYVPTAKIWHKVSASTEEDPDTKWYYLGRHIVPFYLKYYAFPCVSLSVYVVWVLLREAFKGNVRRMPSYLHGIWDGTRIHRGKVAL